MAQNVADGSIVLSLDASQLNQGMAKAAQKAKADGAKVASNFKTAAGKNIENLTGGGSGVFGMTAKAGIWGAAITGAVMLGKSLWDAYGPAKAMQEQLERNAEAQQKWRDKINDSIATNQQWIASLADIAGTAEGAARIDQHFNQIAGSAETLNQKLKTVKEQQKDWDSWGNWEGWSAWMVGGHGDRKKALEEEAKALKGDADAAKKAAEAREKFKQSQKIQADSTTRQFVQDMKDAVAVMNGADKDLMRIEAMKRKGGFSDDQIGQMRAAVGAKLAAESAKELAEANKQAADWTKELSDELGVFGTVVQKTAEDKKLEELISKGADSAQINRLKTLIALKKKQGDQYKALTALERGSAAEISFQNKTKFEMERDKKIDQELKELRDQTGWLQRIHIRLSNIDEKPVI